MFDPKQHFARTCHAQDPNNTHTKTDTPTQQHTQHTPGLRSSLKQLDLSFNRLGDSGARALAAMLAAVPLLALELEGNKVGGWGRLAAGGRTSSGSSCVCRQVPFDTVALMCLQQAPVIA